jgi:hypothetical protein
MRHLLVSLSLLLVAHPATAQTITWTLNGTPDRVQAGAVGSPAPFDLWVSSSPSSNSPWGIAYNPVDNRVYWADLSARQVNSVKLDGTGVSTAFSFPSATLGPLVLDAATQQIYFEAGAGASSVIVKANLDGTGQSNFATHSSGANGWMTVDPVARYLYWSDTSGNFIRRANLDGTPVTQNVVDLNSYGAHTARGLALDGQGNLYWVDNTTKILYRLDISGYAGTALTVDSSNQLLSLNTAVGGNSNPNALASDGQWLYWADGATNLRGIYRVRTDGTGAGQLFAAGGTVASPIGVTIVGVPEPATWAMLAGAIAAGTAYLWRRRKARLKVLETRVR